MCVREPAYVGQRVKSCQKEHAGCFDSGGRLRITLPPKVQQV